MPATIGYTIAAETRLTRGYSEAIVALERSHVVALVVDVTANGGGTDWVERTGRAELTAVHLIAQHEAFVRSLVCGNELKK